MPDHHWLDELIERIARLRPQAGELGDEFRTTLRQLLQSSLGKLNVLTRDEFDAQLRALERAEQRIAALEQELSRLESLVREQDRP